MEIYSIKLMSGRNRPRTVKHLARRYVSIDLALLRAAEELEAMSPDLEARHCYQRAYDCLALAKHIRSIQADMGKANSLLNTLRCSKVAQFPLNGDWVEVTLN